MLARVTAVAGVWLLTCHSAADFSADRVKWGGTLVQDCDCDGCDTQFTVMNPNFHESFLTTTQTCNLFDAACDAVCTLLHQCGRFRVVQTDGTVFILHRLPTRHSTATRRAVKKLAKTISIASCHCMCQHVPCNHFMYKYDNRFRYSYPNGTAAHHCYLSATSIDPATLAFSFHAFCHIQSSA